MTTKQVIQLGLIVFGILTLMSFLFFRERIGHIDMAFQTFLILKSGSLEIQSGRFGAAVTQFWPWLAQSIGLPLKGVMMAYSFGHVLWPAFLFAFCIKIGQLRWALILLLGQVMMTTQTFWWLSEMPQGLPFLIALLAWLDTHKSLKSIALWQWPMWIGAVITAFYFHPLVMWPALFLCLFLTLKQRDKWPLWAMTGIYFMLVAICKYFILKPDWYDVQAMARAKAFADLWPHWVDLKSNHDLMQWCVHYYYWLPLCWIVNTAYYATMKKWFLLVATSFFPLAFIFLVNVPHHESTHQFYMENLYLPLGLMISIPLCFDVLTHWFSRSYQYYLVLLICISGIARIGLARQEWTQRMLWEKNFLQQTTQMPAQKWVIKENQSHRDILKMSWSTPYEFLLLSALEGPDKARCLIITDDPSRFDTLMPRKDLFLGTFKNYPFEQLPSRYFNLSTENGYELKQ
jgi:hypothetical protein